MPVHQEIVCPRNQYAITSCRIKGLLSWELLSIRSMLEIASHDPLWNLPINQSVALVPTAWPEQRLDPFVSSPEDVPVTMYGQFSDLNSMLFCIKSAIGRDADCDGFRWTKISFAFSQIDYTCSLSSEPQSKLAWQMIKWSADNKCASVRSFRNGHLRSRCECGRMFRDVQWPNSDARGSLEVVLEIECSASATHLDVIKETQSSDSSSLSSTQMPKSKWP